MIMKTDNHEVIFAIVDAGFAEDVMDLAREQGARGGTILNARVLPGRKRRRSLELPSTRRKRF